MHATLLKTIALTTALAGIAAAQDRPAREGLHAAEVERLLPLIRHSPGEDPFSEIAWFVDLEAAQRKAASEGKPLFVFANGGEPLGGT